MWWWAPTNVNHCAIQPTTTSATFLVLHCSMYNDTSWLLKPLPVSKQQKAHVLWSMGTSHNSFMTGNQCGESSYTKIPGGPLNSRRFPGFPGGVLNSRRFPGFPGVVDTLHWVKMQLQFKYYSLAQSDIIRIAAKCGQLQTKHKTHTKQITDGWWPR